MVTLRDAKVATDDRLGCSNVHTLRHADRGWQRPCSKMRKVSSDSRNN